MQLTTDQLILNIVDDFHNARADLLAMARTHIEATSKEDTVEFYTSELEYTHKEAWLAYKDNRKAYRFVKLIWGFTTQELMQG